jgi:uncharacterized protein (DUF1778 family)
MDGENCGVAPWVGLKRHPGRVDGPQMYCHSEYMGPTKEQRLQIRVDPGRKQLLERAADAAHQNLSAFVLGAASRHAEEVLAERSVIELSPQAAQAFSDALAQPARVNERLAAALDRPRQFRWVD